MQWKTTDLHVFPDALGRFLIGRSPDGFIVRLNWVWEYQVNLGGGWEWPFSHIAKNESR